MYKWLFTGLGILLVLGIFLTTRITRVRKFDRSVQYSPTSFKPYDTRFFYLSLKKNSNFQRNTRAPGGAAFSGTGKTYVICSPYFFPDRQERRTILRFVSAGNTLIISSFEIEPRFLRALRLSARPFTKPARGTDDSLKISWEKTWSYPGSAAGPQILLSSSHPAEVVASDGRGFPALIRMKYGKGTLLIQSHPMVLTNYFLLHKENATYLDALFREAAIPHSTVIWDDHFANTGKTSRRQGQPPPPEGKSFFWTMVRENPPLQWAVFTALAGTLLFLLNYARRLREPLEVLPESRNNSLAFSRTIAELHRRRKDHTAIAQKIRLQLLEHLHQNYRLQSRDLIPENADTIHRKTGKPLEDVVALTEILPRLQENVSEPTLIRFYKLVYKFIFQ